MLGMWLLEATKSHDKNSRATFGAKVVHESVPFTTSSNGFSKRVSKTEQVSGMSVQDDNLVTSGFREASLTRVQCTGIREPLPRSALGSEAVCGTPGIPAGHPLSTYCHPSMVRVSPCPSTVWPLAGKYHPVLKAGMAKTQLEEAEFSRSGGISRSPLGMILPQKDLFRVY